MTQELSAFAAAMLLIASMGCHPLGAQRAAQRHCGFCGGGYDQCDPSVAAGQSPYVGPPGSQGIGAHGGGPATAAVAYPYYTIRGPRDFLHPNPPSIGR